MTKKEQLIEKLLLKLKEEKDFVDACLITKEFHLIIPRQRIAFCTGKALQKLLKL